MTFSRSSVLMLALAICVAAGCGDDGDSGTPAPSPSPTSTLPPALTATPTPSATTALTATPTERPPGTPPLGPASYEKIKAIFTPPPPASAAGGTGAGDGCGSVMSGTSSGLFIATGFVSMIPVAGSAIGAITNTAAVVTSLAGGNAGSACIENQIENINDQLAAQQQQLDQIEVDLNLGAQLFYCQNYMTAAAIAGLNSENYDNEYSNLMTTFTKFMQNAGLWTIEDQPTGATLTNPNLEQMHLIQSQSTNFSPYTVENLSGAFYTLTNCSKNGPPNCYQTVSGTPPGGTTGQAALQATYASMATTLAAGIEADLIQAGNNTNLQFCSGESTPTGSATPTATPTPTPCAGSSSNVVDLIDGYNQTVVSVYQQSVYGMQRAYTMEYMVNQLNYYYASNANSGGAVDPCPVQITSFGDVPGTIYTYPAAFPACPTPTPASTYDAATEVARYNAAQQQLSLMYAARINQLYINTLNYIATDVPVAPQAWPQEPATIVVQGTPVQDPNPIDYATQVASSAGKHPLEYAPDSGVPVPTPSTTPLPWWQTAALYQAPYVNDVNTCVSSLEAYNQSGAFGTLADALTAPGACPSILTNIDGGGVTAGWWDGNTLQPYVASQSSFLVAATNSSGNYEICEYEPGANSSCSYSNDSGSNAIESLATGNGQVYAALANNVLWNCDSATADSCVVFDTASVSINTLAYANDRVYAGLQNGIVWTCDPVQANSCATLDTLSNDVIGIAYGNGTLFAATSSSVQAILDPTPTATPTPDTANPTPTATPTCDTANMTSSVYVSPSGTSVGAIAFAGETLYVGLDDGGIVACPSTTCGTGPCVEISSPAQATSAITAMAANQDTLVAGTQEGELLQCTPTGCTSLQSLGQAVKGLALGGGQAWVSLSGGALYGCAANGAGACTPVEIDSGSATGPLVYVGAGLRQAGRMTNNVKMCSPCNNYNDPQFVWYIPGYTRLKNEANLTVAAPYLACANLAVQVLGETPEDIFDKFDSNLGTPLNIGGTSWNYFLTAECGEFYPPQASQDGPPDLVCSDEACDNDQCLFGGIVYNPNSVATSSQPQSFDFQSISGQDDIIGYTTDLRTKRWGYWDGQCTCPTTLNDSQAYWTFAPFKNETYGLMFSTDNSANGDLLPLQMPLAWIVQTESCADFDVCSGSSGDFTAFYVVSPASMTIPENGFECNAPGDQGVLECTFFDGSLWRFAAERFELGEANWVVTRLN